MPSAPPLVIVAGPPAAGKSTLAMLLSRELRLPVISKDLLKEAMMDHVGGGPEVGRAAFAVQFAITRTLLESGAGVILEGAFFSTQAEISELASVGDPVSVSLGCSLDELERRYVERHKQGGRHPLHRGLEALDDLRRRVAKGEYGLPELSGPNLDVSTTHGFEPATSEIVSWVRAHLDRRRRPS